MISQLDYWGQLQGLSSFDVVLDSTFVSTAGCRHYKSSTTFCTSLKPLIKKVELHCQGNFDGTSTSHQRNVPRTSTKLASQQFLGHIAAVKILVFKITYRFIRLARKHPWLIQIQHDDQITLRICFGCDLWGRHEYTLGSQQERQQAQTTRLNGPF